MNPEILMRRAFNKELAKAIQPAQPEPDTFDTDTKALLSKLKELELQQKLNTRLLKEVCDKTKTVQAGFKKLAKTFDELAEAFK